MWADHLNKVSPGTGCTKKRPRVHDKGMSIIGTYEWVGGRKQVFGGSHNWTENALRDNDEVLLRVSDSAGVYQVFYVHQREDEPAALLSEVP